MKPHSSTSSSCDCTELNSSKSRPTQVGSRRNAGTVGGATSGTSHVATPCNALGLAGTVAKLSLCTTMGSPALTLGTTFRPVAARTNGPSSDSIKAKSVPDNPELPRLITLALHAFTGQ